MLSFETIIKATLVIVALFVIIIIATNLFPDVMKNFFEVTHLEDFLDVGKEKQQSNFEITENMEDNVKIIKEKILELSSKDYVAPNPISELTIGRITFDLTTEMEKEMEETEFEKFEGNMLAIIKIDNKKSNIAYISVTTQIFPSYETINYNPCVVDLENEDFKNKRNVKKILFVDKGHFKVSGETTKYKLKGLTKIEDDVCFVGE